MRARNSASVAGESARDTDAREDAGCAAIGKQGIATVAANVIDSRANLRSFQFDVRIIIPAIAEPLAPQPSPFPICPRQFPPHDWPTPPLRSLTLRLTARAPKSQ